MYLSLQLSFKKGAGLRRTIPSVVPAIRQALPFRQVKTSSVVFKFI